MTEQQEKPAETSGRGPLSERPQADAVPAGYLWECDDSPDRWRSDGARWWVANAETDGWHLAYAEDLSVGAELRRLAEIPVAHRPQPTGLLAVLTQQACAGHLHLPEWVIVMERREAGDVIACIGVRPNGEQIPLYLGRIELVQVRNAEPV